MNATLTIDEKATATYARTIARACRKLEKAGLVDEASELRAFATARIEAARAAARTPEQVELAELARRARRARPPRGVKRGVRFRPPDVDGGAGELAPCENGSVFT